MPVLSPKDAIDAAIGSYAIEGLESNAEQKFSIYPNLTENFSFSKAGQFESKTGAFFLRSKSGFGVIAKGKGKHAHEALVAIRGTATLKDWLTDGNIGTQMSSTGKLVHAGFNRVFSEFETDLSHYFRANDILRVHCVGHSLGGALASMVADWLGNNNIAEPYLYTFGSPRVGFKPFAERLTLQTGKNNIFRVHHHNDIVGLVPIWPFVHVPQPGLSCSLQNHSYNLISAHYKENYATSLKGVTEWGKIKVPMIDDTPKIQIENWLSMDSVNVLSTFTLHMISSAIRYIINALGIGAQLIAISGISILDQLSYVLDRAVQESKELAGWVTKLMQKILSAVGQAFRTTSNMTIEFIRWVFNLLNQAVSSLVNTALAIF